MYCLSVCEVVRRRHFSHRFHSWAEGLAEQRLRQHMRELDRRKRFHQVLSKDCLLLLYFIQFLSKLDMFVRPSLRPFGCNLASVV